MFWSSLDHTADGSVITLCGIPNTDEPGDKAFSSTCVLRTHNVIGLATGYGKAVQIWCNDDGSGKLPHPEREDDTLLGMSRSVLSGVLGRAAYQDALFGWSGLCRGDVSGEGDLPPRVRDEVDLARTLFPSSARTERSPHVSPCARATPWQFAAYQHGSIVSFIGIADFGDFCASSTAVLLAGPGRETAHGVIRMSVHFVESLFPAGSRHLIAFMHDLCTIILACWDKDGRGYGHVLEALSVDVHRSGEVGTVIPAETVRAARVLVDDPVVPSDMYYFVFRADDLLAMYAGKFRTTRRATVPWACDHAQLLASCPFGTPAIISMHDMANMYVTARVDSDSGVGMCVLTGRINAKLFEAEDCAAS